MKRLLSLFLLSLSISCGSQSAQRNNQSAPPSPSVSANNNSAADVPFSKEDEYERSEDSEVTRQEARQKAIEYAQQNFPGWNVKGIISRRTFDKHYQVTLDLQKSDRPKPSNCCCDVSFLKRVNHTGKLNLSRRKVFLVSIKNLLI